MIESLQRGHELPSIEAERASLAGRLRPGLIGRLGVIVFFLTSCGLAVCWMQQSISHYLPKNWAAAHEDDGLEDWVNAQYFLAGKNPYSPASLAERHRTMLGHPPTTAFWFIPIAHFPKAVAAELISLSTLLLLLLHLYLCAREIGFPAPISLTVLIFGWFLTTDGMTMHWHAIQLSEQIAFPLTLCWIFLRRGRDVPAGIALGVAATFKLFPGLLMLFLLLARRFRAFFVAVGVYLSVAIFMTTRVGLSAWPMFFKLQDPITRNWMGTVRNASLQGIVLRVIASIASRDPMPINPLPERRATIVATIVAVALLALALRVSWRTLQVARHDDPRALDLPFSLFALLAVFLNPWIWEHYTLLMIQPVFVLAAALSRRLRGTARGWLDENAPGRRLWLDAAAFSGVLVGLGAVVAILQRSVYAKIGMVSIYSRAPTPWYAAHLQALWVLSWLPWVIVVAAGFFVTWYLSPGRTPVTD